MSFLIQAGSNKAFGKVSKPQDGLNLLYGTVMLHVQTMREKGVPEDIIANWDMFADALREAALRAWLPDDADVLLEGPDEHLWGVVPYAR